MKYIPNEPVDLIPVPSGLSAQLLLIPLRGQEQFRKQAGIGHWGRSNMKQFILPALFLITLLSSSFAGLAPSGSAADTARDYYLALNGGNRSVIDSFYSTDYFAHLATLTPELQKMVTSDYATKMVTKNSTVTKVDVTKEVFPDYGASVTVSLHYKDGTSQVYNADMKKENGVWKILYR